MTQQLEILAPTRYPWLFNSPKRSAHNISIRTFLPLNYVHSSIEGVTFFNPLPLRKFDLIHAFNRIPIGRVPFIIGFESHLPRVFGREDWKIFAVLSRMLASDRCRKIVAISRIAERQFLQQHGGRPWFDEVASKLIVRYPNISIPPHSDGLAPSATAEINLVFVGNHFVRKGGLVALRVAQRAHQMGFPLKIDIVSGLQTGINSWIGPTRAEFLDDYRKLLDNLPNVKSHGSQPNSVVLDLIGRSHFLLLPTFSDTFGYSAIEAMARYTPVIATDIGALPEFIEDRVNGILLPLEKNEIGEWRHEGRTDRHLPSYEQLFRGEIERLAESLLQKVHACFEDRSAYFRMRQRARVTAEMLFSPDDARRFWDDLYHEAVVAPSRSASS
jgi:glycosyltransferase involved in cell wall biosynthesis